MRCNRFISKLTGLAFKPHRRDNNGTINLITCLVLVSRLARHWGLRGVFSLSQLVSVVPPLAVLLRPLQVGVEVVLSVRPLAVVALQVEPGIVPAGGVAHVVLGEPVLILPPLHRLLGAELGDGEVLLPVVSPVQLTRGRLSGSANRESPL